MQRSGKSVVARALALLALLAALGLIAAGCGSSGSSSSSSTSESTEAESGGSSEAETEPAAETESESSSGAIAEAEAAVTKALEPVKWKPPGEPIDVSSLKGKNVWYVDYDLSIPFEQELTEGLTEGMEAAGVNLTVVDGKSMVSNFSSGIEKAIAQNADAILLGGFPTVLVKPALAKAKAAGIPVIATHTTDPGPVTGEDKGTIAAYATHSYSFPGEIMADFTASDSEGSANVALIESKELDTSNLVSAAFLKELGKVCPECSVKQFNVPVAQWNGLQSQIQSILRSNPEVNYVVPVFDGMALFMIPGITTAGKSSSVKMVTFNASPGVMEYLAKGDIVAAEVGDATVLQGWGYADQTFRVLLNKPPLDNIGVPERLFTEENIESIDLEAPESTWYTKTNYQEAYKKLWGLE
ncbi:MAG: substrate-binding domain-containing protein [Actinobacteria bacterium]|nr:substrate-binding domain-containing protein [Actinomycetota bacterium]